MTDLKTQFGRVCDHGRLARQCNECSLEAECQELRAELARLTAEHETLRQELTDWILIADGVKHDPRCPFNATNDGPKLAWPYHRCQVESLQAELAALRASRGPQEHMAEWFREQTEWFSGPGTVSKATVRGLLEAGLEELERSK